MVIGKYKCNNCGRWWLSSYPSYVCPYCHSDDSDLTKEMTEKQFSRAKRLKSLVHLMVAIMFIVAMGSLALVIFLNNIMGQ